MRPVFLILSFLFYFSISAYSYSFNVLLKDLKGQAVPFESLKGKWVFINYWASWCQPCLDEIKELNQFYQKNKEKIALYAINYDHLPFASQLALIKKYKIDYPCLESDPARDLELGEIRGVPATFVFNPEGALSTVLYGGQTQKSLTQLID